MSGWHDVDKLAGLVVVVSALFGLWRGATRLVLGLATLLAAVALAASYGARVGQAVSPGGSPLAPIVGAAVVYVGVVFVGWIVARWVRGALDAREGVGAADRAIGLVLGAGRGVAYVAIGVLVLRVLPFDALHRSSDDTLALGLTRRAFELVEPWLAAETAVWVGDALRPTASPRR